MTKENLTPEQERAQLLNEAKDEKKKLDEFEEKLKNMAGSMGVSEEELDKEGLGTKPKEPKVEASKAPEDIAEQKAVKETREKYINEFVKYRKETRAWQGFSTKTLKNSVRNLGQLISKSKEEKYVKDKYPNLETLKADYDRARVELGNKMYAEKKAELEKTVTDPDELKAKLDEYKKLEIFTTIHLEEQVKLNAQRAEKLPPVRRELLNKALGKGADVISAVMKGYKATGNWGKEFNIKGHKVRLGQLVRSSVFALGTAYSFGATAYGIKLARSFLITTGGGVWMAKLNSKHQENITKLNEDKAKLEMGISSAGEVDLLEYEKQLAKIDSEIKRENRKHGLKSAGVMALMLGANYGSAKAENAMFGHGAEVTGSDKPKVKTGGNGGDIKPVEPKPTTPKPTTSGPETPAPKAPDANNNVNNSDSAKTVETKTTTVEQTAPVPKPPAPATDSIPKEALIDAKHNVGITYALKSQLEANSDLAHKLGYDVAPNKAQFLADLGKKLGYINEHGDVRVQADMGAAYVLGADFDDTPYVHEYQNGKIVETHDLDTNFEGKDVQEKYEYYQENEVPAPKGGKSVFDGPAESIAQSGPRVEGSPDEFAGEAENIGGKPLDSNNPDSWVLDSRSSGGRLNQELITENKKLLSTNGAAEEMARRAGVNNIAGTQDANTINLESTEQFLNEKQNILNKTFYNIASWSNDYNHARWDHVKLIKMDELARPEHEFASRGEAKSVARLLTKARDAGIDYHGKTADQLVNEIVKKGLVK